MLFFVIYIVSFGLGFGLYFVLSTLFCVFNCDFVFVLDTVLGSMLRCPESLGREILIQRRNSGQGFLRKVPSLRLHINRWILDGKTTVLWCSGGNIFCINFLM